MDFILLYVQSGSEIGNLDGTGRGFEISHYWEEHVKMLSNILDTFEGLRFICFSGLPLT